MARGATIVFVAFGCLMGRTAVGQTAMTTPSPTFTRTATGTPGGPTPTPTPTRTHGPTPRIYSVAPRSGPATGGTNAGVQGQDLLFGGTLSFGSTVVPYNHASDSLLFVVSPSLPAGLLYDINWQQASGNALLQKGWLADFLDVPQMDVFHASVETVFRAGITAGCGGGNYCRDDPVTRDQMAVFLLKAEHGSSHLPPNCLGVFTDVACPSQYADWIEELGAEGITGGCGGGKYCPDALVTRAQMAVFLLKSKHGPSYVPPACVGVFADVACPGLFADWIEQLAAESITGGCGGGNYCPQSPNTRGQMSVFVTKTFSLAFSGP